MSFSSGLRAWRVLGLVYIICCTSRVCNAGVELTITPEVVAQCGETVTLTCEATLSDKSDIKLFSWVTGNKTVCKHEGQPDPEVLCESTAETPQHRLTLTLNNVMPVNQGTYLCKIRSILGVSSSKTSVSVQDCFGSSDSSMIDSQAKCWFSGVYPSGTVHWFRGDENLTDSASQKAEKDRYGRFSVSSTVDVKKGNLNQSYYCSLWIPSARKYLSRITLPMVGEIKSSGSMVKLQWISIIVEIMLVKIMT